MLIKIDKQAHKLCMYHRPSIRLRDRACLIPTTSAREDGHHAGKLLLGQRRLSHTQA